MIADPEPTKSVETAKILTEVRPTLETEQNAILYQNCNNAKPTRRMQKARKRWYKQDKLSDKVAVWLSASNNAWP